MLIYFTSLQQLDSWDVSALYISAIPGLAICAGAGWISL
jgi:hypothetical protein